MLIKIPDTIWNQFKYSARLGMTDLIKSDDDIEDAAAFMMVNALANYSRIVMSARGPYEVEPHGDGWIVVHRGEGGSRVADGEKPRRDKSNALRKAHRLNHKYNLAVIECEENEKQNGGAIII